MVDFVEIASGIAPGAAQVDEVNAVGKPAHHLRQVVIGPHPEGAVLSSQSLVLESTLFERKSTARE
ncbi:hypothetical protein GCM10022407_14230 [Hymenobacter antarcticus]|uniref:Uncharacterized protein n=1 Tax=Hymenobacter antarcticus TaxID=486270 RepID=A0ABP7PQC4_9BACT